MEIKIKDSFVIIMAITTFLLLYPYFVWDTYHNVLYAYMPYYFMAICYLLFLIKLIKNIKMPKKELIYVGAYILINLYLCLNYATKTFSFGGILLSFLVVIFLFMNNEEKIQIYKIYLNIYVLSILIGIIPYILLILNINLPYELIIPNHVLKASAGLYYKKIFGTVVLYTPPMLRYSAMFDEPGVVGTFSALFLTIEQYNLRLKKNKILFVSGILSFSSFFYIITIIWIFLKYLRKINCKTIMILSLLCIGIVLLQNTHTPFAPLNRMLTSVKIISDNFVGNSRYTTDFVIAEKLFYNENIIRILFGNGRGWANNHPLMSGSWTYKFLIFDHGIVGFLMIILWIVIYVCYINRRHKYADVYIYILIFMLSIYQRPYVMNMPYLVILIGGTLKYISSHRNECYYREEI